ncbi:acyltransferase family protein [Novosphingobium soli]|uniref:Acyltransferase family protein n=1 Tax=Novosphingobium soli TaxID=574956 RepID=A0ABV6CXM5_9SPHN
MQKREELTGIQFLRGFCALGVVIGHCAGMLAMPKYGELRTLGGVLEDGALGVDIFFTISGFIMAVVALEGSALKPRMSIAAFAQRRFVRIIPMMWIAILSYAVLQKLFARDAIDVAAYLRALFLLPFSYVKPDIIWTLRQELIFYLVFALSFFGRPRMRWLLAAWLVSPVVFLLSRGSLWASTGYIDNFWSILCSTVNLEFGMGLALGVLWTRASPTPRSDWALPVHPFVTLAVLVAAILGSTRMLGLVSQTLPSVLFLGVTGTMLVGLAARARCPAGWLTALGGLLGDASYSIYLFHLHILAGLLVVRAKLQVLNDGPAAVTAIVVASTAICIGIHLLVERPLTRWLRARFAGGRPRPAQPGMMEKPATPPV